MKVLTVGAHGATGQRVTQKLIARGHQVTGMVRTADQAAAISRLGAKPVNADLEREKTLPAAVADQEAVIFAAGSKGKRLDTVDKSGAISLIDAAQLQNMLDFPPAPKLDPMTGRLDPRKATEREIHGEQVFFGKGQCAGCHTPPFNLDYQMHDLHLERFLKEEPGDGPIKTFTLRGIKDSPP